MIERKDAAVMLMHAKVLLDGVRAGCSTLVRSFFERGLCAKVRPLKSAAAIEPYQSLSRALSEAYERLKQVAHADMERVYAELQRQRFVGGGAEARGVLAALAHVHLRDASSFRQGYGSSWEGVARVAALLGDHATLKRMLPRLPPAWRRGESDGTEEGDGDKGRARGRYATRHTPHTRLRHTPPTPPTPRAA